MGVIGTGILEAVKMLTTADPEVLEITARTLRVSGTASVISVLLGIPLGTYFALKSFTGRNLMISFINLGMGFPPVVVGLITWLFLSRNGPLGFLGMIYNPSAMVVAQTVIATPIVTGFTIAAIQSINPKMPLQIRALGANRLQFLWLLLREARFGLLAAVIAGFGRTISEVGASMMVGGNVRHVTRVLTTAIALDVSKGNFELATALGIVLLLLSFLITAILTVVQQHRRQP